MFSHSVSDRLDDLKKSVTKADTILKAVLKSLKTFHKAGELFDKLEASWTASMKDLEENSHITEAIQWIPLHVCKMGQHEKWQAAKLRHLRW